MRGAVQWHVLLFSLLKTSIGLSSQSLVGSCRWRRRLGAGRRSEQSISTWKRQFLEGGKSGLAESGRQRSNQHERALLEEIEELKAALGEAHVECGCGSGAPSTAWARTRTSR